ncbi:DUF3152 domain-containing protein [Allokutzneria multivorans]|uniref:DUF3152 domain-containing protein n=1 Tax=Allokutzneria multivorans TaxID=1142134 RepID=A0ABP7U828_9PSEU
MTRTEHGQRATKGNGGSARPIRPEKAQQAQRVRRERRNQAEPLVASWQPRHDERDGQRERRERPKRKTGVAGAIATYGWRVYALPVLVVLTVLAFVDFGTAPPEQQAGSGPQSNSSEEPPEQLEPVVAEAPPGKIDVNIPTAELPKNGDKYTEAGPNTFSVVRGSSEVVGSTGKLYRYTIEIENGIDASVVQGEDAFARVVDGILASPKSWIGSKTGGVRLQRVDSTTPAPDFRISLTTPGTTRRPDVCNYTIQYEASCWNTTQDRVYINLARWVRGAIAYGPDLGLYRTYAINHEVGHVFRNQHRGCSDEGGVAPVMMQQSFGVANNYVALLNQADANNKNAVKADGKTCKPNPWPNP